MKRIILSEQCNGYELMNYVGYMDKIGYTAIA